MSHTHTHTNITLTNQGLLQCNVTAIYRYVGQSTKGSEGEVLNMAPSLYSLTNVIVEVSQD